MAWCIEEAVIRGEIDNCGRGRVTGRIWFVGRGTGGARSDTVGSLNRGQEGMQPEGAVLAASTVPWRHQVRHLFALCAGLIIPAICFGEDAPVSAAPNTMPDAPLVMPKITVTAERLNPRWLIPKADLTQANFKGVAPEVIFPARARFEGIFDGRATVGVMLDADGNATDFLLIRYSRPYFGEELMRSIHNEKFSPRRIKGVAIPGRFYVNQRFYLNGKVSMTPMDAIAEFTNRITNALDGPPFVFQPHLEHEIDGGKLQFTAVTEPLLPGGFEVVAGQPLKVIVSFYVDEKGNVRLPNVESNTPVRLIPNLVKAVTAWSFVPPTIGGKPALLFAVRSITLDAGCLPNGSEIPRAAGDTGNR